MERESFEDPEVAELLNRHFVAIKVDREERPDIDHIYMTVCQAMTGQGGWPLTVILTPDQRPFFAGTYFPKERRFGRMGLLEILQQIHEKWEEDPDKVVAASLKIMDQLKPAMEATGKGEVEISWIEDAYDGFRDAFDEVFGGFGDAPKFPTPHNLMFLLRYGRLNEDVRAIDMVEKTLMSMYRGGIYDHVGFGFARYSTDREWLVPHFEKMLYDNALLAMTYVEAYQVTKKDTYKDIARDVLEYVLRDMTSEDGAFYSAEDADSEGEEGKFYLWTVDQVVEVLGEELGGRYCRYYDVTPDGNFEGRNIPNLIGQSHDAFCAREGVHPDEWAKQVRAANRTLFQHRERRVHPHKDDKVLTSWNALMIVALAKAGRAFHESTYIAAAERALQFINDNLKNPDGRLLARFRDGHAAHLGYLDDYAFLTWACIELYEATFQPEYLAAAVQLQDETIRLFWDERSGGFYFYGSDAETLIVRPKEVYDGATPSGNSVAALNLVRLGRLTGNTEYERLAGELFSAFADHVGHYPMGHTMLLMALQLAHGKGREMVVVGSSEHPETQAVLGRIQSLFLPDTVLIHRPTDAPKAAELAALCPYVEDQVAVDGKPTIYICENFACQQPLTDVEEAIRRLR
jgi:uncharacterized protein